METINQVPSVAAELGATTSVAALQAGTEDFPMPTVENEAPSYFVPGNGLGSADMMEILLMYLLHLTNSPITVAPGVLRIQPLPAERVAQLSEKAQRFMKPSPAGAPA